MVVEVGANRAARLVQAVQDLSRSRTIEDVQTIVRRAARELSGADGATFVLRDGDKCFYADEDAIAPLWKGHRFPMESCVSGWVMLHRRSTVIEDIYADDRIPADLYRPTFVKSLAMVPIRTDDPIGAIGTYWAEHRAPSEEDMRVLQALADSTSIALENIKLYGELEERIHERTVALELAHRAEAAARHELDERLRAEELLKRTEEQLRHSQKMDAIGKLAGGIAHDFNNMLSVVLSYTSLVSDDLDPSNPVRDDLEEIRKAGERAAALTRQLLAFSRQQVLELRVIDLEDIVTGTANMLRRLIGADVELEVRLAGGATVLADPGQIEQVLLNLVINARDAMPDGGKLTIETGTVTFDSDYASQHFGVSGGQYRLLAVSDTGVGMTREVQERIFEPFFTTKEKGRGTGLGLPTAYGIVKQSGGHIWVYSEPGVGTTFKVYLPKHSGATSLRPPAGASRPKRLGGTETVLLVEDDDQVRTVARGILKRSGYEVLEANGPEEAIAVCTHYEKKIHLLLTDIVMPRMSGVELARTISAMRPATKALWMSGYAEEAALRHGMLHEGMTFVQKPLTPEGLLSRVRQSLDG
ncbi:sensory box histidine kinase/response regulator [Labilithrix luteola]|uniref:histidine kinase n=1 Tax=Labilithrix luteola TaxID=1391654 RepID=A0A0K1QF30_9BACT|nr:ATP-binding protein [Labilithrix luteola]AKV04040.1 sensory box histidine kinase/response regulator [Labilithrix luteola]